MNFRIPAAACAAALLLALSACSDNDDHADIMAPTSTVGGVAAIGSPLTAADVRLACRGGVTRTTTTTSDSGSWSVLVPSSALPCAVRVNGGRINGGTTNTAVLYSIAAGDGDTLVSNITPLTDLAMAQAVRTADGRSLADWYAAGAPSAEQVTASIVAAQAALLTELRDRGYTVPEGFNPFSDVFQAIVGNLYDDLLEAVATALAAAGQSFEEFRASYVDGGDIPATVVTPGPAPDVPATHYIRRHWAILEGIYSFDCGGAPLKLRLNTNGSFSVEADGSTRNYSATTPDYFFNYDASPGRPDDIMVGVGQGTQLHFTLNNGQGTGPQPDQKVEGKAFTQCSGTQVSSVYTLPQIIKTFKGSYAASCGDAGAQVLTIGEDSKLSIAGVSVTVAEANSLIAHDSLQSEGSTVFADGTFKLAVVGGNAPKSVEVTVDSPTSTIKKVNYRNGSTNATCTVSGPTTEPPAPAPANVKIAQKIGAAYAGSYTLSCEDFSTSSGRKDRVVTIAANGSANLDGAQIVGPNSAGFVSVVNKTINLFRDDGGQNLPKVLLYTDDNGKLTGGTISEQPNKSIACTANGPNLAIFPLQETVASYARSVAVTCTGEAISGAQTFVIDAAGKASLGSLSITPEDYLQFRFFEFYDSVTFNAASDRSGNRSQIYIGAVGKSIYAYLNRDGSLSSLLYAVSTTTNGVQSTKQGSCTP